MFEGDFQQRRTRVLIADEMALIAAGTRALLEPDCDVVGTVADGRALLSEAEILRPDIIVMEILLPLLNGLDALRPLVRKVPESKIVLLTAQESSWHVAEAFKAGASGYVLKRSQPSELTQAIHAVLMGQWYLTPLIAKNVVKQDVGGEQPKRKVPTVSTLTPRQREVLQLIAEGRGTKEVATLLNIAVKTVEFHKFRIMDQLNLHSTVALAKHAIIEGLVRL
ncbi:MAG: response regulator transcription factor [Nitrospira sp.]|nr:response regulator transcription factor [Nitrospira sp.]MCW5794570.1 response regulator transcription factor [Nitrospira sp.]HMU31654.1 response regulator transcription factor [Nitrospira sp.]HNA48564.1 response regulator transcription factor [Nitrospira sp.]HNA86330.1 response regulator transcription factor [Nitrospira sp.]